MIQLIILVILYLLSYFTAKKTGASNGTAALTAAGVTAGAYYSGLSGKLASGVSSVFSSSTGPAATDTAVALPGQISSIGSGTSTLGTIGSSLISGTSDVLKSWGPVGTVGAVAGVSTLRSSNKDKWLLYGGVALAAFLLLK